MLMDEVLKTESNSCFVLFIEASYHGKAEGEPANYISQRKGKRIKESILYCEMT